MDDIGHGDIESWINKWEERLVSALSTLSSSTLPLSLSTRAALLTTSTALILEDSKPRLSPRRVLPTRTPFNPRPQTLQTLSSFQLSSCAAHIILCYYTPLALHTSYSACS
eukprot:3655673-Rhodomonas_salina.1